MRNKNSDTLGYIFLLIGAVLVLFLNYWLAKGIFLLLENFGLVIILNETIREKTNMAYTKIIKLIRGDR